MFMNERVFMLNECRLEYKMNAKMGRPQFSEVYNCTKLWRTNYVFVAQKGEETRLKWLSFS